MTVKDKVFVEDIVKKFQLEVIVNKDNLHREVKSADLNRAGLELSGMKIFDEFWDLVYFGTIESEYLKKFSHLIQKEKFEWILKLNPPALIIGPKFKYSELLIQVAKKFKVPIIKSDLSIYQLNFTLSSWLVERLSPYSMHHGSLSSIFGVGTLLIGESGSGKSEITIELIKRGHIFVADDAIQVRRIGNKVFGEAIEIVKDFIEIRGLGILSFSRTFGIEKMIDSVRIELVIELVKEKDAGNQKFERLGQEDQFYELQGEKIHYYKIPVLQGRNMSDIIETAVTNFKLKSTGFSSADEFIKQTSQKEEK